MNQKLSLQQISDVICSYFDVTKEYIDQKINKREICEKRQFAHKFAKKYTSNGFKEIGDFFGKKDHTTVMNSCKIIDNLIETNPEKLKIYNEIDIKFKKLIPTNEKRLKLKSKLLTNMIRQISKIFPLKTTSELIIIFKTYKDLIIKL